MLIVLAGKSGSGKSALANYLQENYPIKRIRTVTTRPKRPDVPTDETDYHFVSDIGFFDMQDDLILVKRYDTVHGRWWYGVKVKDLKAKTVHKIIILDPKGVQELKEWSEEVGNIPLKIIECTAPDEVRISRTLKRADDINEVNRRLQADNEDFKDFQGDIIIDNSGDDMSLLFKMADIAMDGLGIKKGR